MKQIKTELAEAIVSYLYDEGERGLSALESEKETDNIIKELKEMLVKAKYLIKKEVGYADIIDIIDGTFEVDSMEYNVLMKGE